MFQRILVSVIGIPLIFLLLLLCPPVCIPIVLSLLSMVGVHEVIWSTGFVKHARISGYSVVLAGLIPFWVFAGEPRVWMLAGLLLYLTLLFVEAIGSRFTVTLEKMGGAFIFAVLIPYFLSAFVRIGELPGYRTLILLPLVPAFASDACALFAGVLFGKRKLAPTLSPNKTVAGAIGGLTGSVLFCLGYGAVVQFCFDAAWVSYPLLVLYGLLGSAAGQLGDLSFSYIKRQYQIKDFGNIFPGHGGALDRLDSVIFAAPLIELLLVLLPAIGA